METLNRSKHWELHAAETHFKTGYLLSNFKWVGNIIYSVAILTSLPTKIDKAS